MLYPVKVLSPKTISLVHNKEALVTDYTWLAKFGVYAKYCPLLDETRDQILWYPQSLDPSTSSGCWASPAGSNTHNNMHVVWSHPIAMAQPLCNKQKRNSYVLATAMWKLQYWWHLNQYTKNNLDHMVHYQPNKGKTPQYYIGSDCRTMQPLCEITVYSKKKKKRDLNNIPQYEATQFSNMQFTVETNIMRTLKRKY